MMCHAIRIGPDWLRCLALLLVYPPTLAGLVLLNLFTTPARLVDSAFWLLACAVFTAAWRGEFVPK